MVGVWRPTCVHSPCRIQSAGRFRTEAFMNEMLLRISPIKPFKKLLSRRREFNGVFTIFQIHIQADSLITPRGNSKVRQSDMQGGLTRIPRCGLLFRA